ncbi:hypothetical protein B0H16DRAFT_1883321 [Mycena metata]|uniref:Uncharacterized protein n=1 Tax=Mycena metata TaxID=1033252 RepID=A0AAD7JI66_9AGAR|nr:hypothetical protein B0H16DRAFT_1883321 [Mycena metata]
MLTSSFTFLAATASFLLAVSAAPLGERGSVVYHTSENHAPSPAPAAVETSPPWRRASPFSEDRVVEPTPPGWRRAPTPTPTSSLLLERVVQPTPPGWRRAYSSVAPQMQSGSDGSPIQDDAPGWKRHGATDADPTPSPLSTLS